MPKFSKVYAHSSFSYWAGAGLGILRWAPVGHTP